jgi:iron complex transport system ATP-binding protein
VLELAHVSKKYGNKYVVEDITLTIAKGKLTSFIGPNGAGKSTILSLISQLIAKDEGEIRIDGELVEAYARNRLAQKISILKQSNPLNVRLTVQDLVGFGRFPYSRGRLNKQDKTYVDQAINYMELRELRHYYLDQLSGGERQRAFIAMILAQNTEYILLDEPLNNLDMKHEVQIMKVLRKMVDELGKTIVLVIHDINFASCYSDDIVALRNGKIVQQGPAGQMIRSDVLKQVYDMDIYVNDLYDHKICFYFS